MATPRRPQIEQMLVFDWSELKTRARIALFGPLEALGAAGRGRLRVRPRSAPVAPGLDGADEGLVPLGDLGGALVADLARLDAHRGVREASPAGGSPSSAARAAPPLRRAQPVERDTHLPCRDACDGDVRCGATGIIRGAAKTLGNTTEDVFERRQVDEDAGHATAGPIPQAPCTSGLDRTRRRAHRARPTPPRAPYADAAYVAGGRRGRHWYDRAAAAPIKLRRGVL